MQNLLSPLPLKGLSLGNRVVMAPMTRARSPQGIPDELTATYYRQRASAGLLITEGVPVSEQGTGYLYTPGIYRGEQVSAWKTVTDNVHAEQGKIVAQLWHVGRVSHRSIQPNAQPPVSSVALAGGQAFAYDAQGNPGNIPASEPQALDESGIADIVDQFRVAACHAMQAGFDGVEIHAANGYLLEQFINPKLNTRDDRYGGQSLESRSRFTLEVVDAVCAEIGAEKVGIRLSPYNQIGDMPLFDDTPQTYLYLAEQLNQRDIAYIHLALTEKVHQTSLLSDFRERWHGALILAGGISAEQAEEMIKHNQADLIAFGSAFISNPDLVERIANGWPWAPVKRSSFYGGGREGYVDYPRYEP